LASHASDLLFRWFVGLSIDDPVWDATVFSKNRERLLEGEARIALSAVVFPNGSASLTKLSQHE